MPPVTPWAPWGPATPLEPCAPVAPCGPGTLLAAPVLPCGPAPLRGPPRPASRSAPAHLPPPPPPADSTHIPGVPATVHIHTAPLWSTTKSPWRYRSGCPAGRAADEVGPGPRTLQANGVEVGSRHLAVQQCALAHDAHRLTSRSEEEVRMLFRRRFIPQRSLACCCSVWPGGPGNLVGRRGLSPGL